MVRVDSKSDAKRKGIQEGDIILAVGRSAKIITLPDIFLILRHINETNVALPSFGESQMSK